MTDDRFAPEVLLLTETLFIINSTEYINGYDAYNKVTSENRSDGVSVYVKQSLGSELVECMCVVNLDSGSSNIYALGIYRPHAKTITNFTETIITMLSHNRLRNTDCVVIGDLNINLSENSSETVDFKSALFSFHYLPLISEATVFSSNAAYESSCLDHIWINKVSNFDCDIVENYFTDNCSVFVRLRVHHVSESGISQRVRVSFRDRSEGKMSKFIDKLCVVDLSDIKSEEESDYLEGLTSRLNCLYRD